MGKSKKSASTRYRDSGESDYKDRNDEERVAEHDTDDDEDVVFDMRERHVRRGRVDVDRVRVKRIKHTKSMCWRYFLFLVVLSLGIAMIVQLYSSYGEFITDQIFPPRVTCGGVVCGNGTVKHEYQLNFDSYEVLDNASTAGWVHLNATKPKDTIEWAWDQSDEPHMLAARWRDDTTLSVRLPSKNTCATVVVLSV